jgi:hypothetical protein
MQEPTYTTKRFKSWSQFKAYANRFSENWLFRGQSDATWDLKSSFERTDFFKKYDGIELSFLLDFQRGAKNFLTEKETPTDLIEWLALMQHHGAPTRLLDFTKSVYIASYFAFENTDPKTKNVAIWAININILRDRAIQHLNLQHTPEFEKARAKFSDKDFESTKRKLTDKDFEAIFQRNDKSCILPVEPFQMNRRYSLQQSVFVSPGNSHESFMEQLQFLDTDITKAVVKITLPSKLKNEVLRELQKMNINRASIFPDLDGYSAALKMKYNSMRTMEEHIKLQVALINDKQYTLNP